MRRARLRRRTLNEAHDTLAMHSERGGALPAGSTRLASPSLIVSERPSGVTKSMCTGEYSTTRSMWKMLLTSPVLVTTSVPPSVEFAPSSSLPLGTSLVLRTSRCLAESHLIAPSCSTGSTGATYLRHTRNAPRLESGAAMERGKHREPRHPEPPRAMGA